MAKSFWQKLKYQNFQKIFLILIIIFALFLRFYRLDKVPPALFSDEADLGYQAYSFLKTGRDYFGKFLPVHFHSFADYRTPIYLYSAVPTIAIFGLNEWGVRLPAAIYGILSLFFFFKLVEQLSKKTDLALVATFLLSITPWHLHYSRAGFEITSMLFFLLAGFWFFFRSLEKEKNFWGASIFLGLAFYTYAPVKLFLPLLFIMILIFNLRTFKNIFKKNKKKLILPFIFFLIIITPLVKQTFWGQANFRFNYISIFSRLETSEEVNRLRLQDVMLNNPSIVGVSPSLFSKLVHNKLTVWGDKFFRNYIEGISLGFLFMRGDSNLRHSIPQSGLVLLILLPFFLIGIFRGFVNWRDHYYWWFFLILAPISSSLTYDGSNHASRLSFLMVPIIYFSNVGIFETLNLLKKRLRPVFIAIFIFALMGNFVFYLHNYYVHYPQVSEKEWHYGFKQSMMRIKEIEKNYSKIYFSSSVEPQLIFYLFWTQYPPELFKVTELIDIDESDFVGKVWQGKYFFGRLKEIPSERKSLLILGRNDLGLDLEKQIPSNSRLINKIYSYNAEPRFYFIEIN